MRLGSGLKAVRLTNSAGRPCVMVCANAWRLPVTSLLTVAIGLPDQGAQLLYHYFALGILY